MNDPCQPSPTGAYPSDCEIIDGYRQRAQKRTEHILPADASELAVERAKSIRLLLLDVDGVLTDGTLYYLGSGEECKAFNTQDGFGIALLHQAGIETGIITARQSPMVERRARELKMAHIYQGYRKKNEAFREILRDTGLKPVEVAYMGDDWLDLVLLQQVGLAITPANGAPELKERVHYITPRAGGAGAVRDACTLILASRGELNKQLQNYLV